MDLIGKTLGRYRILERLGEGGMAIVYKAHDTRLDREIAVKVIRMEEFPSKHQERLLERFKQEARVSASLSHPNIVKVLDYGEEDSSPFLAMELVTGSTLKKRLGKPIPWQEAARLLAPIARALEYAHKQAGTIIHRDVKPSNILLTAGGIPMLSDFGIAKVLENEETFELTTTGAGIGTPEYMAPEQAGKGFDHRVDIYALGTVFYEMVTGRKPFEADTPTAVMIKKNTESPPLPTRFVSNLPVPVEWILLRALARNPHDRYRNMDEFALALESLAGGFLPKVPAPPSPTQTVTIQMANPRLWLGLAGIFAFFFIAAIVLWFSLRPAPEPTEQANEEEQISTHKPILDGLPLLDIPTPIETKTSAKDDSVFVLVPEGEFIMGSDTGDPFFWGAEAPKHNVYLDAFWIHQTEVTNSMYRACVEAGACSPSSVSSSRTHKDYYDNEIFQDYPVINVTYDAASAYCAWIGGRLPTEAEWEKTARGTDGRLFPWGNDEIQDDFANLCDANCTNLDTPEFGLNDGYTEVAPVGSFPAGSSPYGAMDMAGNVLEWTSDWYVVDYYINSPYENPTGPASGSKHPVRGGSWSSLRDGMRPSARTSKSPNDASDLIGFRCAKDDPFTGASDTTAAPDEPSSWQQGKLVFVIRNSSGVYILYTLDLTQDGEPQLLLSPEEPSQSHFQAPSLSADGSKLAFEDYTLRYMFLWGLNLSGSPWKVGECASPSFSPDGSQVICYIRGGADYFPVYDTANGSLVNQIYHNKTGAVLPAWSPDGTEIAFSVLEEGRGQASVWKINVGGGEPLPLATEAYEDYAPSWSPDGDWIAYQSTLTSDVSEVWVMRRDGTERAQITFNGGSIWSRGPCFSPDGQWLAFVSSQNGTTGSDFGEVFVSSLLIGEVHQVTNTGGSVLDWRVTWAR